MFKSKLQELCHEKRWAQPIYSCMKDGADHNPQFKASVVVNGIKFDTPTISRSLKESHNEAAKLAFLHFTSAEDKGTVEGSKNEERVMKDLDVNLNAFGNEAGDEIHQDMSLPLKVQQNYKMKLQMYAQRKKLGFPLYHTERDEQLDVLSFRATVTVGEDIFESPGLYKTAKHAEDAAAQAALMSLSMDAFRENDDCLYKNLLQEFARDNGYLLPEYKTLKSDEAHKLAFFSTVEVEGEIFQGNPAKSKKLAELSSAKIAYTSFMQRKSCSLGDDSSSSSKDEILKLDHHLESLTFTDQQRNSKAGSEVEESKDEDEDTIAGSTLSGADSSSEKTTKEIKTYLLCNRVRVYTYIPDKTFSKGNVVLPIAEGKWVVANLEFPREKDA